MAVSLAYAVGGGALAPCRFGGSGGDPACFAPILEKLEQLGAHLRGGVAKPAGVATLPRMPGKVVVVKRAEKLGLLERLYVPMIVKGLTVTAGHFFRNLRGFVSGKNRTDFVVQYPEELVDFPDAFRGMPVLVQLDNGQPKCVACGLCEFACPTDCISIVPGELEGSRIERYPEAFDIDMSRCMFCGLCEEACPEEAIVMSREVELATYDRDSMLYDKERLLVPEKLLERRLSFLRAEYDREQTKEKR